MRHNQAILSSRLDMELAMRFFAVAAFLSIPFPVTGQDPTPDPRRMLYTYLQSEAKKHFDIRRHDVADLKTPEDIRKRQERLRGKFLEALGGFPDKTPLHAKVVGTL